VTTALVAALYFGGTFEQARALLMGPRDMPAMLSRSRLNCHLDGLKWVFPTFLML
jgi:hypothetical protein